MTSEDVVSLLEEHWQDIREHLGDRWEPFTEDYAAIVDELAEEQRRAVEDAADRICRLLKRDEYTGRILTRAREQPGATKLPLAEEKSVPEETAVQQIHNRMLALKRRPPERAATQREDD